MESEGRLTDLECLGTQLDCCERKALRRLGSFQKADPALEKPRCTGYCIKIPGDNNALGFWLHVRGEVIGFIGRNQEEIESLLELRSILASVREARLLIKQLEEKSSAELAASLAVVCMLASQSAEKIGFTTSKTWLTGRTVSKARSLGGINRKKFATNEQKSWLKEGLKAYPVGAKDRFKKISDYVFNNHGYKSNAKTVRARLKELGLLESA